jgi:hypothetical protein
VVKRPGAADKWGLPIFKYSRIIFNHPLFELQNGNLPDIQNSPEFVG